ncbi:MAG: aldolase/citrate lyase family protein [Bryobacteraceae bacterium]
MRKLTVCAAVLLAAATLSAQNKSYKPKRINRAIELIESGQPIYYTGGHGGYEEGKKLAQTWADYINYELEHGAWDMTALRAFMKGLVDGGPTRSGHRTPTVIVTLPVTGIDEPMVRANSWVIQQVLAAGAHGILLCHARTPGAVKAFVEATRYPFAEKAAGLNEGLRGSGSQGYAAQIWGIPAVDYIKVADPWPLNPKGEIFLGLKIEDRHALQNSELTTKVPGIGFAEWGPGDMGWSFGLLTAHDPPYPDVMQKARARVFAAVKAAKISFLDQITVNNYETAIKSGVKIGSGGQDAAEKGRRYTKREMPW